jgi:hypothetical protein
MPWYEKPKAWLDNHQASLDAEFLRTGWGKRSKADANPELSMPSRTEYGKAEGN